jgi:copper chaperone
MTAATARTYAVHGMSCSHCAASVREEVAAIPGVERVAVDLASGRLDVSGTGADDTAVAAAVARAGYEVTS